MNNDADQKTNWYDGFEKLWQHNQGAMFLKSKYDSLEMKKSLADYFYRHGYQSALAELESLRAVLAQYEQFKKDSV